MTSKKQLSVAEIAAAIQGERQYLKSLIDRNATILLHDLHRIESRIRELRGSSTQLKLQFRSTSNVDVGHIKMSPSPITTTADVKPKGVVNQFNKFTVTVRDDRSEIVDDPELRLCVKIATLSAKSDIYLTVEKVRNGVYVVEYYPQQTGQYKVMVLLNNKPIRGMPKIVHVVNVSDAELQPAIVFGKTGSNEGEFIRPWGVCCDRRGRIIVSDRNNHRIQIFTEDGRFQMQFGRKGSDPGELNVPAGVCVDRYDRIIVADKDNHRICLYDSDGVFISYFGKSYIEENSLVYPWDVAVNDECNIAVTESKRGCVKLYSDSGIMLANLDFGLTPGVQQPRGIICKPDGNFWVTDFDRHKLVLLTGDLKVVKKIGSEGSMPGKFFRPQSLALRQDGLLAVSDCKNHRIQLIKDNKVIEIIGKEGTEPGEFDAPQGIAFHPNGSLIVVDYGNSRIQIFYYP